MRKMRGIRWAVFAKIKRDGVRDRQKDSPRPSDECRFYAPDRPSGTPGAIAREMRANASRVVPIMVIAMPARVLLKLSNGNTLRE